MLLYDHCVTKVRLNLLQMSFLLYIFVLLDIWFCMIKLQEFTFLYVAFGITLRFVLLWFPTVLFLSVFEVFRFPTLFTVPFHFVILSQKKQLIIRGRDGNSSNESISWFNFKVKKNPHTLTGGRHKQIRLI